MTPGEKKKLIIGFSLLAIAGIVGYFIYEDRRKNKKTNGDITPSPEIPEPQVSTPDTVISGSPVIVSSGKPLTNPEDIKRFQMFARIAGFTNVTGPNKGKPISVDGKWGTNTQAAWDRLGKAFLKKETSTQTSTPSTGWAAGSDVYINGDRTLLFSYPEQKLKYLKGAVDKSMFLTQPFGKYEGAGPEGWAKVRVFRYRDLKYSASQTGIESLASTAFGGVKYQTWVAFIPIDQIKKSSF